MIGVADIQVQEKQNSLNLIIIIIIIIISWHVLPKQGLTTSNFVGWMSW